VPGARRRVFYFLEVRVSKFETRTAGKEFRGSRNALTGSGVLLFDNRKAGKFTVRASVILSKCICVSSDTARIAENYCGRLQVLLELSITVEEKADLPII
jgi:hypothetical protein